MPNTYFQFKQFRIDQERSGMKVTTDGCLFGAWVARYIQQFGEQAKHILDIGTGTGLLSLMIAQTTGESQIDAIEINKSAFEEANYNFHQSPWSDQVSCHHTSLQNFQPDKKYQHIVCNPPFFKDNLKGNQTNKNQALHNDHLPMEDLVDGINRLLADDGEVFILYPEMEMSHFSELMKAQGFLFNVKVIVRNTRNSSPIRVIAMFSKKASKTTTTEIIIKEENGSYSFGFGELLEPYYL